MPRRCTTTPLPREVPGWQAEARRFRDDAAARFSPSMRQRIDMTKLYRRALRILPDTIDGLQPLPVPQVCPVTLDEMLALTQQSCHQPPLAGLTSIIGPEVRPVPP